MLEQKYFYEEVGRRILKARRGRKMTQEELGKIVRLTRTSITNIERGRQKLLLHTLAEIATALGVSTTMLLPEEQTSKVPVLDRLLKNRPDSEREFILSAVSSAIPQSTKQ